jgi:hypothetical protein
MQIIPDEKIHRAISVLGVDGISESDIESRILAIAGDTMSARRLIDWIPEAFAAVLIPHVGKVNLPKTFSAKARSGKWIEFEFAREPVFVNAVPMAMDMYHSGYRAAFKIIVGRSSMLDVVNKALNAEASIDGATLSGPAMLGIPAEVYAKAQHSFWRRWFGENQEV